MPWSWSPPSSGTTTGHSCRIAHDRRRSTACHEAIGVDARRHMSGLSLLRVVSPANPVKTDRSCVTEMWSRQAPVVSPSLPGASTAGARRFAFGGSDAGTGVSLPPRAGAVGRPLHADDKVARRASLRASRAQGCLGASRNSVEMGGKICIKL